MLNVSFPSLSHGVLLKTEIKFVSLNPNVCNVDIPGECFHQASHGVCLHQESQAAQRQILMEFLKEARRNKREVSFTPPSIFLSTSCWYCFTITLSRQPFFFSFSPTGAAATGTTAERAQLPWGGHQARGGKLAHSRCVIFVLLLLMCWVVDDWMRLWRLHVRLPGNEWPVLADDGGRVHRAQCWGSLACTKVPRPSVF